MKTKKKISDKFTIETKASDVSYWIRLCYICGCEEMRYALVHEVRCRAYLIWIKVNCDYCPMRLQSPSSHLNLCITEIYDKIFCLHISNCEKEKKKMLKKMFKKNKNKTMFCKKKSQKSLCYLVKKYHNFVYYCVCTTLL